MIAAMSENYVIGNSGELPWHLPKDFAWFKYWSLNKTMVMGRKTFESLKKPLPRRTHWILSKDPKTKKLENDFPGLRVFTDIEEVLNEAKNQNLTELMVIGGGQIYQQFLPYSNRLILTHIEGTVEGDAQFPKWDPAEFRKIYQKNETEADSTLDGRMRNYQFAIYSRRLQLDQKILS